MTNLTPEHVIASARSAYRSIENKQVADLILPQVALDLDLVGEDYEDLVRHLVTADEIDPDAYRWVTLGGEVPIERAPYQSTVPEGYGGGWSGQTF